jgi:hypothetical protein
MPLASLVLDTNALVSSAWPQPNAKLQLLLQLCAEVGVGVFLPEVVAIELEARYRREVGDAEQKARTAMLAVGRQLARADIAANLRFPPQLESAAAAYLARVATLVREYRVQNIPIPDVRLDLLVRAAAAREAPFNDAGEGFRDALIVFSVEAAPPPADAVLLTSDGDFKGTVVPRLTAVNVALAKNIDDLVDQLRQMLGVRRQEELQRDRDQATAALAEARVAIEAEIAKVEIRPKDLPPVTGVTIVGMTPIALGAIRRVDVSSREGGNVEITATAQVSFSYFGFRASLQDDPLPVAGGVEALDNILLRAILSREGGEQRTPFSEVIRKTIQIEATAEKGDGRMSNVTIRSVRLLSLVDEVVELLRHPELAPAPPPP